MKSLKQTILDEILPLVRKPGQYAGGERNAIVKNHADVDLKVAVAFPDTYAVGMSHLGIKIIYHMLNGRKDVAAERVFAPWVDMEEILRARSLPLYSLETFTPLDEFDVVGFSLQYELCYTNVLNMLELGRIPLETSQRTGGDPVVIAGGSISVACEPLAPFLDAVLVGDAEETIHVMMDRIIAWKRSDRDRSSLHRSLAEIPGVYVPCLYDISYGNDGVITAITPKAPAPRRVKKATVSDLEHAPVPLSPVMPNVEVIHDRMNVEIMRGCPNHCRFCQAVQRYRPLKIRSPERILEICEETYWRTGYDEINLASLSSADYPHVERLMAAVNEAFSPRRVSVSLPSLRVGGGLAELPSLTSAVRKAGITIAPEVGSDRLRALIKKPISNRDLLAACEAAYRAGYRLLKFYFLIGLPGERESDLAAIAEISDEASRLRKKIAGRRAAINVAVSSHVPKPHTPLQWEHMDSREELRRKQAFILSRKRSSSLRFKFHDVDESYLEAVFSRGDRRLSRALVKARERGMRMDAWSECFRMRAWEEVFADTGLDPDFYALRRRREEEILPWDMIASHTPKSHLLKEKAEMEATMESIDE
jgi:radical SAM family uncharacterized protein